MNNYSIVITTFDQRFKPFLIPLISQIRKLRPEVEILLMVNGNCHAHFNEQYRAELMSFISGIDNCFPTIFPQFQSLAKLWNRGILNASNDRVLVLNDDLGFEGGHDDQFFVSLEESLDKYAHAFQINGSFSHFVVSKGELLSVGCFDERLLGLGEEDGDFFWRYHEHFGREIADINILGISNIHSDIADTGYTKGIRTASKFNREFIKKQKYQDILFGGYRGMFDKRVKKVLKDENQYPYEGFYLENRHKL